MSMQRFGRVDIDGLWQLRRKRGDFPRFASFDERKDVAKVGEQWYNHVPGTEYLATNPVDVPELTRLIESCAKASSDAVFSLPAIPTSARDPFHDLSPELRAILLEMLERRDVANLRLSSKAFSQLPQTYFRQLIEKEMPWVWELHDTHSGTEPKRGIDWFALWNKLSASDGGDCVDEQKRAESSEPHSYDGKLEIKGLRNRRMIHRDINVILDMIADARAEQAME